MRIVRARRSYFAGVNNGQLNLDLIGAKRELAKHDVHIAILSGHVSAASQKWQTMKIPK